MPVVRFGFSPAPVHVRTARLVAASVAQQASLTNDLLSEVRQAVGEACSRAVARHRRFKVWELVRMNLTIDARFVVEVADFAPVMSTQLRTRVPDAADPMVQTADDDALAEEVALTLLAGLVPDLQVIEATNGNGTTVQMSWPL